MKVKTNIRAGKGGASGAGKNSSSTGGVEDVSGSSTEAAEVVPVYYPPVARCVGI